MECLLCGVELLEDEIKKYCCKKCQNKMDLISSIKQVDNAAEKIEKACHRYLYKIVDYQIEKKNIIEKIKSKGYVFNSIPEVCFALQLEKENIEYIPNFKIDKHKVDFFLPNMKKIVEIDGELYHTNEDKEFLRERAIMRCIGEEYEIVRIPAKFIPNYIIRNLQEAIYFIVEERNSDRRFRDTRWDSKYWSKYLQHKTKFGR